eukprot:CAMPEP_0204041058 /NCGR_PEP_ID=MMETSP0360-20130528/93152_1 /ASSEMBLY_ACC=CAM_ASM_000342 /TAXON_ID=268821 /ORGANISM="Scrippsiella Hangoei, Strain SHTV-5" /LENGTH=70 /DNA_ID=CAMNT_0050987153 /DNA_START=108 /DNA_END=316 /DNA_ORIENTATION=+
MIFGSARAPLLGTVASKASPGAVGGRRAPPTRLGGQRPQAPNNLCVRGFCGETSRACIDLRAKDLRISST